MYDRSQVVQYLDQILEAAGRIERRAADIETPQDFLINPSGVDRLDAICMMLIAIGENLKKIDAKTGGTLLPKYPLVPWGSVKRTRDVLSHGYFDVDEEIVFDISKNRIADFISTVKKIRDDLTT